MDPSKGSKLNHANEVFENKEFSGLREVINDITRSHSGTLALKTDNFRKKRLF